MLRFIAAVILLFATGTQLKAQQRDKVDGHGFAKFGMSIDAMQRLHPQLRSVEILQGPKFPPILERPMETPLGNMVARYFFSDTLSLYEISISRGTRRTNKASCLGSFSSLLVALYQQYGTPTIQPVGIGPEANGSESIETLWLYNDGSKISLKVFYFGSGEPNCNEMINYRAPTSARTSPQSYFENF